MKRIMRAFKMTEISGVTKPAQEPALATIIKLAPDEYWKRDFSQSERDAAAASGAALPDGSFPIKTTADLKNAIHAIGRAKDPAKAKAHIISRAKSLGLTDLLPDGWVSKTAGPSGTHPNHEVEKMTLEEMNKAIAEAVAKATGDLSTKVSDLTKSLKTANETIATLGKAKKKPASEDDGMAEPDADDEDTKKAWRAYCEKMVANAVTKAKAEFEAEITKKAELAKSDESFEFDGKTIRKSVAGEDNFAVMKSLAESKELNDFTKKAEGKDYNSLPGEPMVKAKALRSLSKLDKEPREAIEAMLKSGNAALAKGFAELGKNGGLATDSPEGQIEQLAKAMQTEKSITYADAYNKVLESDQGKELWKQVQDNKRKVAA